MRWRARAQFLERGILEGEFELIRPDGTRCQVEYRATANFLPGLHLSVLRDVTERKLSEDHIANLAYQDQLTGLPNRAGFTAHLDLALARARAQEDAVAVLYLDLERFKLVNDSFGQAGGDRVLREIGERLRKLAHGEGRVARHSGDEFLVLLDDLEPDDAETAARGTAERVHEALRRPFRIEGEEFVLDTSMGISLFPAGAESAEELLRNAALAMYEGKRAGRGETRLHGPRTAEHAPELSLAPLLRTAIEREEFVLHYQPIVELESGAVVGAEALVRWQHPEQGLTVPDEFIPVAEEIGLIGQISDWVVAEAARQARAWTEQGLCLCVSCNLSARDLRDPDLVARIDRHVTGARADPGRLMLEVTETAVAGDPAGTRQVLGELGQRGLRLAIDDFGLGHSTLGLLRQMTSAHAIKIDRSFVRDLGDDGVAGTIVDGIVAIARGLGLAVIAEGVETEVARCRLLAQGCRLGQGFLFSRPVPAAEIPALVSPPAADGPARSCASLVSDAVPSQSPA